MATSSTSAQVQSEEWFHQVNGLLETVEVADQTTQNVQSQPTGMSFFFFHFKTFAILEFSLIFLLGNFFFSF